METMDQATDRAAALQWWRDAKFGMFIHWGLYSIPAGVWKGATTTHEYAEHIQLTGKIPVAEYARLADRFNPQQYCPAEWARLARRAGMRYVVLTTKHQDGFAMYHSAVSDYNVVDATPYGRDPLRQLAEAVRAEGLRMGVYYSQARDHHHPLANWNKYGNTWDFPPASREDFVQYLNEKAKPQLRELLTGYGPMVLVWFDVPYDIPVEESRALVDLVHGLQPGCLVNSRVGGAVWDYESLGDNAVADSLHETPWEACLTMNKSWGYHQHDHQWRSATDLVRTLVDVVSKGGNMLLNVGPTADGVIPPASVERLEAIGAWLDVNGESIYAAQASPIGLPSWGRCTARDGKLYLHVFEWPADGRLVVTDLPGAVAHAALLADGKALSFTQEGAQLTVSVPAAAPDPAVTVIALDLTP